MLFRSIRFLSARVSFHVPLLALYMGRFTAAILAFAFFDLAGSFCVGNILVISGDVRGIFASSFGPSCEDHQLKCQASSLLYAPRRKAPDPQARSRILNFSTSLGVLPTSHLPTVF